MTEAPASKPKNDNPTRWETTAKSHIEEGGDDLFRAAQDITDYAKDRLGEWACERGLLNARNAVRKIEWGMEQLKQTRLPNYVEKALMEE